MGNIGRLENLISTSTLMGVFSSIPAVDLARLLLALSPLRSFVFSETQEEDFKLLAVATCLLIFVARFQKHKREDEENP